MLRLALAVLWVVQGLGACTAPGVRRMSGDEGSPHILRVHHESLFPKAGESFILLVELDRKVKPEDGKVEVLFEKHQILLDGSGTHMLRTISEGYFAKGYGSIGPIAIPAGHSIGATKEIRVDPNATIVDENGNTVPVRFPTDTLFSAYLQDLRYGFESHVVRVSSVSPP